MTPEVPIAVLRLPHGAGLPLPAYATVGAAGLDVVAAEDIDLAPGARAAVATGFALAIPDGWEVQVRPRSGLALRHGVTCLNTPGTIDHGYTGELVVLLENATGATTATIKAGDRIAQLVVTPIVYAVPVEVDALPGSARGAGGFGSTGRN